MSSAAFPGPSISDPDLVLIFDLDGTILAANSFPTWVRYMLRGRFGLPPVPRLMLSLRTAMVMARRKLGRLGHLETKRRLQRLWGAALAAETTPVAEAGLLARLNGDIRPGLDGVLAHVRHGRAPAVLTTAAAGDYALPFARHMGFLHALATPCHDSRDYIENVGQAKHATTLDFLKEQGWHERRRVFFTDHIDDLPLILVSHLVFWFGGEEELAEVVRLAPGVKVIPCTGWTTGQMLEAIDGMMG